MKLENVPSYTKAESILNVPGKFFFQIEDNDVKPYSPLNKKIAETIKTNIQLVFKKISDNLRNPTSNVEYYKDVVSKLDRFANTNYNFRFPGLQVKSLNDFHLETMSKCPDRVLICEKSDGVRFLLFQFANNKVLFLGRNLEFFIVDLTEILPKSQYNAMRNEWDIEHFLDGELIIDKSSKENEYSSNNVLINNVMHEVNFLVFDAVVLSGVNVGHLKFKRRLQELTLFFKKIRFQNFQMDVKEKFVQSYKNQMEHDFLLVLQNKSNEECINKIKKFQIAIFMKDYFTFDKIEYLYTQICHKLNHENDGIILNLDDYPYYTGPADEIFKWKPAHLNTVDFEITYKKIKENHVYVLNVSESRDKLLPIGCLFFKNKEELETFKINYQEVTVSASRAIVECYYDAKFNTDETVNFNMLYKTEVIIKNNRLDLTNYDPNQINEKRRIGYPLSEYNIGSWRFMRFRKDKSTPNNISVFLNISQTIQENMNMDKIIEKIKEKYLLLI
jgi:ATP-dependent DNA ligase